MRAPEKHRLDDLLGMHVVFADGRDGDQVSDVRLVQGEQRPGGSPELVVDGLVVGRRRPGSLLGYDRHPSMGPWVLRLVVRALHRHSGFVAWADVARIDWEARVVHLRVDVLGPLTGGGGRTRG